MEVWIRTQDKEMLLKVNTIKYEHYKPFLSDCRINAIILNDNIVQEYKTKERALEVLDDIHDKIAVLETMSVMGVNEMNSKMWEKITREKGIRTIYQMPEE